MCRSMCRSVSKCGPPEDIKGAEGILFIHTCVCAPFSGPAVHTGGKPHVAFQGGDACRHSSRADLSAAVRPEEEKRVGPALQVSTALEMGTLSDLISSDLKANSESNPQRMIWIVFFFFFQIQGV